MPTDSTMRCPECGAELNYLDELYAIGNGDTVAGCTQCLHPHNAAEWFGEQEERYKEQAENYWRTG